MEIQNISMKKSVFEILFVILLLSISKTAYADEVVNKSDFESEQLYNALLEICDEGEYGNYNGLMERSEAEAITNIFFTYDENNMGYYDFQGEISLKGIENFSNLMCFSWHYMVDNVPQLTGYEYLPSLTDFQVWFQENEDWSFLEKHSNLLSLYLDECNVKDISFLEQFPELQSLSLSNCDEIEDYSYIEKLNNLITLDVSGTKIDSIQFIEDNEFFNLENLYVSNTLVSDISPVTICEEKLQCLGAIGLGLTEIPDMTGFAKLGYLSLDNNYLTEEEILSKIPESVKVSENWQESVGINSQLEEPVVDDTEDGNANQNNSDQDSNNQDNANQGNTNDNGNVGSNDDVIKILTDGYVNVQGVFETGTYLVTKRLKNYYEYKKYEEQLIEYEMLPENGKRIFYDISLYKDRTTDEGTVKEKVQPLEPAKVSVQLSEEFVKNVGEIYVIRWEEDGSMTLLDSSYKDGIITFISDHFSIFSIVMSKLTNNSAEDEINDENIKDENYEIILEKIKIVGFFLCIAFIIGGIVVYEAKRRNLLGRLRNGNTKY